MNKQSKRDTEDRIAIEYYTDPLCCWSWALEPQWRRLRYAYNGQVKWRYRMGGLIPNWNHYNDPMNNVSRPIQMGPVWMEAKHLSGMPMDSLLWHNNPPESSYPACLAVKCAARQSPDAAELYLRKTREAVMINGRNIGKQEILIEIGNVLGKEAPEIFDAKRFISDLRQNAGLEGFREDMQKALYHKISRFPTLTISKGNEPGVMIVGYRPYDALVTALEQVAPGIKPTHAQATAEEYEAFWGKVLPREMEEVVEIVAKVD